MIYRIAIHGLTNRPLEQYVETREVATDTANRLVVSLAHTSLYVTVFVFSVDRYGNPSELEKHSTR